MDQPQESQLNSERLLTQLHPDLYRIYSSVKSLLEFGGNGSIEIHFVKKRIKAHGGIYIKPGITEEDISRKLQEIR